MEIIWIAILSKVNTDDYAGKDADGKKAGLWDMVSKGVSSAAESATSARSASRGGRSVARPRRPS